MTPRAAFGPAGHSSRTANAARLNTLVARCGPSDLLIHFILIDFNLLCPQVSQIMKQVSENNWEGSSVMLGPLLVDLTTKFCSGNRWMLRQSYVNICNQLVTDRSLPLEEFAKLLLEPLLALKQDRVPNVRLVLARVINLQLKYHEFFAASDSPYRTSLDETLTELSADLDRDVSYYATMKRHPGADVDYTSSSSSTAA